MSRLGERAHVGGRSAVRLVGGFRAGDVEWTGTQVPPWKRRTKRRRRDAMAKASRRKNR